MVKVKEYKKESALKKKLLELEQLLVQTKKKLQNESEYNKQLEAIIQTEGAAKKSKIITIKSATKIEFISVDDIVCCNADEAYTDIQLIDKRTITAAKPLTVFDSLLAGNSFFRISKSHLINTNHIVTFHKDRNQLLMKGNIVLTISRRKRVEFLKTIT